MTFKSQQLLLREYQSSEESDKNFTSTNESDCQRVIEANRDRRVRDVKKNI
jgi:hypothetical protein